jgi:hypothetical protein
MNKNEPGFRIGSQDGPWSQERETNPDVELMGTMLGSGVY